MLNPTEPTQVLDAAGWARIHDARAAGTLEAAVAHVGGTLLNNRGYLGALGESELSLMIVNNLIYDGWTLTPPAKEDDDPARRADQHRRPGGSDGQRTSSQS